MVVQHFCPASLPGAVLLRLDAADLLRAVPHARQRRLLVLLHLRQADLRLH